MTNNLSNKLHNKFPVFRNPTEETVELLPQIQEMQTEVLCIFLFGRIDLGASLDDCFYFTECKFRVPYFNSINK